jgi:hypothetical protein
MCKTILNKVANYVFINKYNYSNFRVLLFIYFSFPRPISPTLLIQYKVQVVRRECIEDVAFEGRNPGIMRGLKRILFFKIDFVVVYFTFRQHRLHGLQ